MLEPGVMYKLMLNYNRTLNEVIIYLRILNSSYIATEVRSILTLYNQGLAFSGENWFFTETTTIM